MVQKGLSLAEVVLAMFLLLVLIVSVVSLFLALINSSAKSNDQAVGALFADRVLEHFLSQAQLTYPAFPADLTGAQGFYTQDPQSPTAFFYTVTAAELTPLSNANATSPGESWYLETEVRWWTNTTTSRAGYGNLFVRQGRVVYVSR